MKKAEMEIGKKYKWKNDADIMVYIGNNWSGNGYWHQFTVDNSVWCELKDADLAMIELAI